MNRTALLTALMLALSAQPAWSHPEQQDSAQTQQPQALHHPKLVQGKLGNGMSYMLLPHAWPAARLNLWLVVNAGSLDEEADQRGVAHLLEHMLFNGTTAYPGNAMIDEFARMGLKFGRDVNAFTEYKRTVYQISLPTNEPEKLEKALGIIRQWMAFATLDKGELDRERGVVIEEWRSGQGVKERLTQKQQELAWAGSRHLERDPIGDVDIVRSVPRERVLKFYRDWYQPGNMSLLVAGDFSVAPMRKLIDAQLAQLPSKPAPARQSSTPDRIERTRHLLLSDPEATASLLKLSFRHPSPDAAQASTREQRLQEQALLTMFNRRLSALLEQRSGTAIIGAGGRRNRVADAMDSFDFIARVTDGRFEEGAGFLLDELERARQQGFTETEWADARKDMLAQWEQDEREAEHRPAAKLMQEMLAWQRDGEPFLCAGQRLRLGKAFLKHSTLGELNQHWKAMIATRDRLVMQQDIAGEKGRFLSAEKWESLEAVAAAHRHEVYQSHAQRELPALTLPPGHIVAEKAGSKPGSLEWRLSNGARVLFVPSNNSANSVQLAAYSPRGRLSAQAGDYRLMETAELLLGRSGLAGVGRSDLNRWKTNHRVSIKTQIGDTQTVSTVDTEVPSLEAALQLLHLSFTAEHGNAEDWPRLRGLLAEQADLLDKDPEQVFAQAIQKARFDDSRIEPLNSKEIESLDLQRLRNLIKDWFANAADFTFIVTGPLKAQELRPLMERYIASLPGGKSRPTEYQALHRRSDPAPVRVEVGNEDKGQIFIRYDRDLDEREFNAADSVTLRAFSDALGNRLRKQLREASSGVYSVRASFALNPALKRVYGLIGFSCAPQRCEALREQAQKELNGLLATGVSAQELDEFRTQDRKRREEADKSDRLQLAQLLSSYQLLGNDALTIRSTQWLDELTPEHLNAAAQKMLTGTKRFEALRIPGKLRIQ